MKSALVAAFGIGGDLPVTTKDALAFVKTMTDPSRCDVEARDVTLRYERDATRRSILSCLEDLARRSRMDPERPVVVFYSGHGYRAHVRGKPAWFLVPHGFDSSRPEETGIRHDELAAAIDAIRAQGLLLVLDCCFAGGFNPLGAVAKGGDGVVGGLDPDLLRAMRSPVGRVFLASSGEDTRSWADGECSLFTRAVIEGLCGYGGHVDGVVDALDVARWALYAVPLRRPDQKPQLYAATEGFPLAMCAGGAKEFRPLGWSDSEPIVVDRAFGRTLVPVDGMWRDAMRPIKGRKVVGEAGPGRRGTKGGGKKGEAERAPVGGGHTVTIGDVKGKEITIQVGTNTHTHTESTATATSGGIAVVSTGTVHITDNRGRFDG